MPIPNNHDADLEAVSKLFRSMGATEQAIPTMARQLIKRADQIAGERGISRTEATQELLQTILRKRDEHGQ